jgi:nucleoside-diphosphate-sugar epimerase
MTDLPTIVVTGASGFLGSRLVRALRVSHRVVAIDRQPRGAFGFEDDPDVVWFRTDLSSPDAVKRTFDGIRDSGGARFLVHLAAYYDFTGKSVAEYQRTNVEATRLVVENSLKLGLERFFFASSIAACDFSTPGSPITERTPPDGKHVYAVTKKYGERLLSEYADRLPSCIVRFAALFSDWCEYPPLYFFLETWLSDRWNSRILGGRGTSAIPYLHVRDATAFMLLLIDAASDLEPAEIVLCSADGDVSHQQLFDRATEYAFGRPRRALHVPKPLCRPGMWARDVAGRLLGDRPFERPWMADFIDRRMEVDASHTRRRLGWKPRERLEILGRIPFMIENARTSRMEWYARNLEALEHHELRPRFRVYQLVRKLDPELRREIESRIESLGDDAGDAETRDWIRRASLRGLIQSIRTGEKSPFIMFCRELTERSVRGGASCEQVVRTLEAVEQAVGEVLARDPLAAELKRPLRDSVGMTFHFGIDQVKGAYERRAARARLASRTAAGTVPAEDDPFG